MSSTPLALLDPPLIMTARNPLKRSLEAESENDEEEEEEVKSKRMCYQLPVLAAKCPASITSELPPPPVRQVPVTYEEALQGTAVPVRVYADGIFDLFHNGHARVFMQVKQKFPNVYLIVGVCSDEQTHRLKGKTVCSETERYDSIRHCRYVDEVLTDAPWTISLEFMERHQIDFVAHDDAPYTCDGQEDIYKHIKDMGRFVPIERTKGISTSDLISRIVRDYDIYLRRNLARGYSARDLNVGYIKEKEVRLREKISNLRHGVGEKSKDLVSGFLHLFGRDGRISEFFHGQKEKIKRVLSTSNSELFDSDGSPPDSPVASSPSNTHANGNGSTDYHSPGVSPVIIVPTITEEVLDDLDALD